MQPFISFYNARMWCNFRIQGPTSVLIANPWGVEKVRAWQDPLYPGRTKLGNSRGWLDDPKISVPHDTPVFKYDGPVYRYQSFWG